jgi:hypothetical protein
MIARLRILKESQVTWSKLTFSWQTKVGAIALGLLGVAQAFIGPGKDTTLVALVTDGKFQLALVMAIIVWFTKSTGAHGTQDAPIPPAQAAQIARVAATLPATPTCWVGAQLPGSAHIFISLPGDPTPVGTVVNFEGSDYKRVSQDYYEVQ